MGVRNRLQRLINFDGTLKVPLDGDDDTAEAQTVASIDELLVRSKDGDHRTRLQELQDTAKLVDTTLFRAHMLARPSLAGSLFRLPNFCDVEVVKEKLLETHRYNDLVDFLFGKKLHREALDLLEKFGKGETGDGDTPEQLRGPQRTIAYLQNLPPEMIDVILQYAEWTLHTEPDLGMEIFLADTENAETLPRGKVLEYLHKIDAEFAARYLEHVIVELKDETPDLHQRLIEEYLQALKSADDSDKQSRQARLLDMLKTSQHYESWRVLRILGKEGMTLF